MQQEVHELRIAALVITQDRVPHEKIGLRQRGQQALGQLYACGKIHALAQAAQGALQLVDAAAAKAAVNPDAQAAQGLERVCEASQARRRIAQVMQDAAAVDVVEGAEVQASQILDRTAVEADVGQTAPLNPRLAGRTRGTRKVEIDNLSVVPARIGQLLGEHDGSVAGAAAGHQGAKVLWQRAAGEQIVTDLQQPAGGACDQAPALFGRIAGRVRIGLVLG